LKPVFIALIVRRCSEEFELTAQLSNIYNSPTTRGEKDERRFPETKPRDELIVEIIGTLNLRFKKLNLYYEAGWTDSFCHRRCMHEHQTLIEAAQCAEPNGAGWYVLAVEKGTPRQLLGDEEEVVERFRSRVVWKTALSHFSR